MASALAGSSPPTDAPGSRNAALAYSLVWLQWHDETVDKIGHLPRDGSAMEVTEEQIELARGLQEYVGDLIRASRFARCDFEFNHAKGAMLVLPHIRYFRASATLLLIDAKRCREGEGGGDTDGAVERLAAVVRLAEHQCQDGIFVSGKVGCDLLGFALADIRSMLGAGEIDADNRRLLLEALDRFPGDDPFGFKAAIVDAVEGTMVNSGWELLHAERERIMGFSAVALPDKPRGGLTKRQQRMLDEQLELARGWEEAALEAWDADDPVMELRRVSGRVSAGEFGKLAKVATSPLAGLKIEETEMVEAMDEVRKLLEADN
jgi:hypothetical protein